MGSTGYVAIFSGSPLTAWMGRYQELHGDREVSMHAHFYEHIKQVPRLEAIMQWYEISTDPPRTGMRSYQWLLYQVELLTIRDREKCANSESESTLNSRDRQARLTGGINEGGGGGRRASATAATAHRLGSPTDKTA
eukprot:6550282-Pyramimonas_sp.AAC.1